MGDGKPKLGLKELHPNWRPKIIVQEHNIWYGAMKPGKSHWSLEQCTGSQWAENGARLKCSSADKIDVINPNNISEILCAVQEKYKIYYQPLINFPINTESMKVCSSARDWTSLCQPASRMIWVSQLRSRNASHPISSLRGPSILCRYQGTNEKALYHRRRGMLITVQCPSWH
jgi:hypothetical protein